MKHKIIFLIVFLSLCGQAWGAGVTDWWDANYAYRKLISCGNHAQYETDHFIYLGSVDVTGAKFMDNGNDIRIVYQTTAGQTDLGRYVIGVNTSTAFIYWQIQATVPLNEDIGDESDYKYYLYYGYASAGAPETYTNTDCIDAPYSVDAGTEALWHCEEASGTVYDETANDNDATVVGGTFGQTGKFGKCLTYDGSNDYAWVNWYEDDPPAAALTIDFWVYLDRDSQIVLGFNANHTPSTTYDRAFCVDGAGRIRWKVFEDAAGPAVLCTSTTTLNTSTWYHVAGVIDVVEGLMLYIDGSLEATTEGTDGGYMGYLTVEFLMGLGDDGGWEIAVEIPNHFDGKIDEVRISDATRTAFNHNATIGTLTLGSEEEAPSDGVDKPRKNIMSGGILK